MNKEGKTTLPFPVIYQQHKNKIYETINEAIEGGIPCYLLEDILTPLLYEIKNRAQSEYTGCLDSEQNSNKETV